MKEREENVAEKNFANTKIKIDYEKFIYIDNYFC